MAAERVECVDKTAFYEAVYVLKSQQKTKQSQITLFVEEKFYNKAKQYLKSIIEDDLIVDQVTLRTESPSIFLDNLSRKDRSDSASRERPSSRRPHNVSAIDLASNNNNPKEMEVQ